MPAALPTVRSGSLILYPFSRLTEFDIGIIRYQNGKEQRFRRRPPLHRYKCSYKGLVPADVTAIESWFDSIKGQFDSTWTFTQDVTYSNLTLMSDTLVIIQQTNAPLYDCDFEFRQTILSGLMTGVGAGAAFPTLANGALCQLPYQRTRRYKSSIGESPGGKRYAWAWYAGALSGFPTGALMAWQLTFPTMIDADADTIEAHYIANGAMWRTFQFTDPDNGTVYSKVRYTGNPLERRFISPGVSSLVVTLEQLP